MPKDTVIFVNNHSLNMSDELWEQPQCFRPDRFLDADGVFSKVDPKSLYCHYILKKNNFLLNIEAGPTMHRCIRKIF